MNHRDRLEQSAEQVLQHDARYRSIWNLFLGIGLLGFPRPDATPLLICIGRLIKTLGQSFKSGRFGALSAGRPVVQRDRGERLVSHPAALVLRRGCFPTSP
jgi:hypothetical protein